MAYEQRTQASGFEEVQERHGRWTAMAIHLGNGKYTLPAPKPDFRLRRLVQVVADLTGRPLSELRILDLACLEGHYGIEFALHGAEVVGIEGREANIERARFAARHLKLDNVEFIHDDVRNLSRDRYGRFDVVIAAGILYHLDAPDLFEFAHGVSEVCDRLAVIDTFVALAPRVAIQHGRRSYSGLHYEEHSSKASNTDKAEDCWASLDNSRSFWLTHDSLCNLLTDVGFSTLVECHGPFDPAEYGDRKMYVAVKGAAVRLMSSPVTEKSRPPDRPEQRGPISLTNRRRPPGFRFFKRILPQSVKDLLKPVLRGLRLLPPDSTPEWLSQKRERGS